MPHFNMWQFFSAAAGSLLNCRHTAAKESQNRAGTSIALIIEMATAVKCHINQNECVFGIPKNANTSRTISMKVIILNWKHGENDPFSVLNRAIEKYFIACGKSVEILEISDDRWMSRLLDLVPEGIEFAFTWQGLGSRLQFNSNGESIWHRLRIPLICVHGDHPAHMPLNHILENKYCFHFYTNAEFSSYSNRIFRKLRGATVIDIPQLFFESRLKYPEGDHFCIIKNIEDPEATAREWRVNLKKEISDAYLSAAESLRGQINSQKKIEVHDLLDNLIEQHAWNWLRPAVNMDGYHQYHRMLDKYVRSYRSVRALQELAEMPVHIYGRGWDDVAKTSPSQWQFLPGIKMAETQQLYYSRFGIIDISPSKGLHDRTRRAMANGCSFLSSANLEDSFADNSIYEPLFYDFRPGELRKKCDFVIKNPKQHAELAKEFARHYHERFHFKNFVERIESCVRSINQFDLPVAQDN